MANKQKDVPLEKSLERLEKIVEQLESGEVPLEKSIELYEEGCRLGRACLTRLDGLEKQVQLVREGAEGQLETEDFESPEGAGN
ncbi:exodeoxyribonuclease VII small subunit [Candidatus Poribacteria bacterium]|nr:exodeoxyribonuclease VII small subunit [Candidatus Poribacteria bacterium]